MSWQLDSTLHWTEHYVRHGFAVIKQAVGTDFTRPALDEVQRLLHTDLPPQQWTHAVGHTMHLPYDGSNMDILPAVYDQPAIRAMIDTMFGSPIDWTGERTFQLFVSAYDETAPPAVAHTFHIDFVNCPIPIFGSGFMFQVSLVDSESCSGNISILPGSHRTIQKALMEDPDRQYPRDLGACLEGEPFEFAAEAGDVLLFHHLVGHAGNLNHALLRSPRVVLHCQALCQEWLRELDPAQPNLSPWQRSLGTNGHYRTRCDEQQMMLAFREWQRQRRKSASGAG